MTERAWDQGYEVGYDDAIFDQRGLSTDRDADKYPHENPYRTRDGFETDVAALRAAAEGATWPWMDRDPMNENDDATYIAAASPDVVLELLDRLAAAEGAVARVRSVRALIQMWADEAEKRGPADQINTAGVVAMLAHAIKEQP